MAEPVRVRRRPTGKAEAAVDCAPGQHQLGALVSRQRPQVRRLAGSVSLCRVSLSRAVATTTLLSSAATPGCVR